MKVVTVIFRGLIPFLILILGEKYKARIHALVVEINIQGFNALGLITLFSRVGKKK